MTGVGAVICAPQLRRFSVSYHSQRLIYITSSRKLTWTHLHFVAGGSEGEAPPKRIGAGGFLVLVAGGEEVGRAKGG